MTKDLLLLALLLAAPGAGRAADGVDPSPATTAERARPKEDSRRHGADERRSTGAGKERRGGGAAREKEDAPAKAAEPCEPVKPCPID